MTIKEISIERRVLTSSQKMTDLNQISCLSTRSRLKQHSRSAVFRVVKGKRFLFFKTEIIRNLCEPAGDLTCLPLPFY
jgi:hypothetical protein